MGRIAINDQLIKLFARVKGRRLKQGKRARKVISSSAAAIMERGGIGNDQHLQPKPPMRLTVFLQVLQRIAQRHVMFLEKAVYFQPGAIAE